MRKLLLTVSAVLLGLASGGVRPPLAGAAAEPKLTRYSYTEGYMGTTFKIILYAPDEATADKASKAAFARVAELDGIMSDYKPASELMRLCAKAAGDPVKVSDDLWTVLERAQEVAKRSDGAFDVTVGPMVRLWRRARRTKELPDADDIAKAKALVGYDKMKLDPKARTVQLTKKGMQLDLGGIAKGYAADQVLVTLKKLGVTRALVAAGGDIAVGDPPADADTWVVGVSPVEDPESKPKKYLLLKNAAVSTSGDAEQFVEIGGKRYSHIVDPRTGVGLVGRMTATVVAPNGLWSDPLTKVVAVLGPEKGFPIIEETPGVSGYFVRKTDKGEEAVASKRFPEVKQRGDK
jgi:thiamine biosynthesis lipoprotein